MDQSKEDRLRHVIAFFMEESETEARQRMSLESTNLGLARQIAELTADVHNTKDIMDRFLHGYLELFPGDTRVHETPVTDLALQRLEVVRDENSRANVLGTLYHEVCDAYAIANPDKTFTADPDHLRVRLLELIRTKSDRCDSCEHPMKTHSYNGCWFTAKQAHPGKNMVCQCSVVAIPKSDNDIPCAKAEPHDAHNWEIETNKHTRCPGLPTPDDNAPTDPLKHEENRNDVW